MPTLRRTARASAGPLAVGLVAIAVRLPGVWSRPFWEDEVASARVLAEPTLGSMLRQVTHTESTPPLWYFLGWLGRQAGVGYPDLRLVSVLAGGVLAVLVVQLARRFVAEPLALAAGLLTALGAELVRHGHELRAYELAALLSTLLGVRLIAEVRAPSRRNEVLLAATVAAGGLTHYFFAFSVVAALVWVVVDGSVRAVRTRAVVAILSGGAVAAACAPMMVWQLRQGRYTWIGGFHARTVAAVPLRLFTDAFNQSTTGVVLSLTTLAGVAFGCLQLARRSPEGRLVAFLALGPLLEAAAVWGAGMRIFDIRNMIGIGAFVAVALVVALDSVPARVAPVLAAGLVACTAVSLVALGPDTVPPFDRIAGSLVRDGWHGSTPIAVFGDPFLYRGPIGWYLPRRPQLEFAAVARDMCAPIFVVGPRGTVSRMSPGRGLRGATLLVQSSDRARCTLRSRHGVS